MMPSELPEAWRARVVKPIAPAVATVPAVFKPCTTGGSPWGNKGRTDELEKVRTTVENRNDQLNDSTFNCAQLHAGGEIPDCREELIAAGLAAGLGESETRKTVESGWRAGLLKPRSAPPRPGRPMPTTGRTAPVSTVARGQAAPTETAGPKITLQLASDMVHDLFSKPLPPPIVTPFPQLNDLQGGGLRGVNILAAVTGRFKTGLALAQARYTARTRPVIYLSTEVDPRQALARVAAQELGRAWRPLYEDPTAEATVAGAIEGLRLYVMTVASVAQLLDVFSSIPFYEKDPPLVVLDYLQGLSRAAEDRRLAVGCVSEAITTWTRTTGGVVLAVSSISRANYFGTDEKSATDFVNAAKESGDVEYDAASVMFLDVPAPPLGGTSEGRLHVAKARFGSPGTIGLFVDGPSGTFQADPAGGLTADQREVLKAVQAGARSGNEIAKDAGIRRAKVDPCLRALRARNLIDANNNPLDAASHLPRQNGKNAAPLPGNTSEVFPGAETVGASPSEKVFPGIGKQAVSSRTVSAPYRGGTGNTGNLLSLPFRGNGKPEGEI